MKVFRSQWDEEEDNNIVLLLKSFWEEAQREAFMCEGYTRPAQSTLTHHSAWIRSYLVEDGNKLRIGQI